MILQVYNAFLPSPLPDSAFQPLPRRDPLRRWIPPWFCRAVSRKRPPASFFFLVQDFCESTPGDSKWPFHPLVGGPLTFEKGHLTIPKRSQRIARPMFYVVFFVVLVVCFWLLRTFFPTICLGIFFLEKIPGFFKQEKNNNLFVGFGYSNLQVRNWRN